MFKESFWIGQDHSQWPEIIRAFSELPGGPVALNEEFNELWQYMGTFKDERGYWHNFRHRMHPETNAREYHNIHAAPGWVPQDDTELGIMTSDVTDLFDAVHDYSEGG
jgi:hypothetical protein